MKVIRYIVLLSLMLSGVHVSTIRAMAETAQKAAEVGERFIIDEQLRPLQAALRVVEERIGELKIEREKAISESQELAKEYERVSQESFSGEKYDDDPDEKEGDKYYGKGYSSEYKRYLRRIHQAKREYARATGKVEAIDYKMESLKRSHLDKLLPSIEKLRIQKEHGLMGAKLVEKQVEAAHKAHVQEQLRIAEEVRAETEMKKSAVEQFFAGERLKQIMQFASDPKKVAVPLIGLAGLYAAVQIIKIGRKKAEALLFTPKLIKKSSIGFLGRRLALPKSRMHLFVGEERLKKDIEGVVKRVQLAKEKGAPLTNVAFYGLPGTGKTMMAEEIAAQSGMDFAIFAAGDLRELSQEQKAIQIQAIFDWAGALAKRGKKLIIFVDEAEEVVRDRGLEDTTPEQRAIVTKFLAGIKGQRSESIMFIFATNYLIDFDDAVLSRIGPKIYFPLPQAEQRRKMMELYIDEYITKKGRTIDAKIAKRLVEIFSTDKFTKGFGGREIEGLIGDLEVAVVDKGAKLTYEQAYEALITKVMQEKMVQELKRRKQQRAGRKGMTVAPPMQMPEMPRPSLETPRVVAPAAA